MLKIGELDRRIEIEKRVASVDNYGESIITFSTAYTVWAKVDWKRSDRDEDSQQVVQNSDLTFYIRNLDVTIQSNYRIKFDEKYYYIHGIKEIDGREQFLELETQIKDNQ